MQLDQTLSEEDLEEYEAFLLSDEMPPSGMDISTIDGFLAAIVLTPTLIPPSQWLPWIWDMERGEDEPEFSSLETANRILGCVMRHYNMVLTSIEGGWFDPLLLELAQEDGSEFLDAEGWCTGFVVGMSLCTEDWETVAADYPELISPMLLLGTEAGWEFLEQNGNDREMIREAYEAIADAVAGLHTHLQPLREAADAGERSPLRAPEPIAPFKRGAEKVGRNDPCPCGSGKKFKKCCGA